MEYADGPISKDFFCLGKRQDTVSNPSVALCGTIKWWTIANLALYK